MSERKAWRWVRIDERTAIGELVLASRTQNTPWKTLEKRYGWHRATLYKLAQAAKLRQDGGDCDITRIEIDLGDVDACGLICFEEPQRDDDDGPGLLG